MDVRIGIFAVPDAIDAASTIEQIIAADRSGLDIVGVQDHPYQWRFFDTWTLLAYAAGRTERVRLVPDVLNLALRLPSVIAKSVASLDVLSGGRVEVGIGAGFLGALGHGARETVDVAGRAVVDDRNAHRVAILSLHSAPPLIALLGTRCPISSLAAASSRPG